MTKENPNPNKEIEHTIGNTDGIVPADKKVDHVIGDIDSIVIKDNSPVPGPVPPSPRKGRRFLSAIFNMAVGAGATALAKTAVAGAMITCPPLAILLATSVTVGAVATFMCHEGRRRKEKKTAFFSKQNVKDIFNRTNAKVFAKSTFYSLVGGALFLGFQSGAIQDGLRHIFGSTPVTAAVPPVSAPPVAPPVGTDLPVCPTAMEEMSGVIRDNHVSSRVLDAMNRTHSANPHVAAQAVKDLAFFSFNGLDGVPKDPALAKDLFEQAAEKGNWQAVRDLKYISTLKVCGV